MLSPRSWTIDQTLSNYVVDDYIPDPCSSLLDRHGSAREPIGSMSAGRLCI